MAHQEIEPMEGYGYEFWYGMFEVSAVDDLIGRVGAFVWCAAPCGGLADLAQLAAKELPGYQLVAGPHDSGKWIPGNDVDGEIAEVCADARTNGRFAYGTFYTYPQPSRWLGRSKRRRS